MRPVRAGIALLQSLAVAAALVVWCPCAAPATPAAADPHDCCRQDETRVRLSVDPCCVQCGIAKLTASAEPASPATTLAAPALLSIAPVADGLASTIARACSGLPTVSPPLLAASRPLRI